jgi:hypothetical protein
MFYLRSFSTISHSAFGHFLLSVFLPSVILRSVILQSVFLSSVILHTCGHSTCGHGFCQACLLVEYVMCSANEMLTIEIMVIAELQYPTNIFFFLNAVHRLLIAGQHHSDCCHWKKTRCHLGENVEWKPQFILDRTRHSKVKQRRARCPLQYIDSCCHRRYFLCYPKNPFFWVTFILRLRWCNESFIYSFLFLMLRTWSQYIQHKIVYDIETSYHLKDAQRFI